MRFTFDHDFHLHSNLSSCSHDPEQTTERILQYATDNNLKAICLTNHFWDEKIPGASPWYEKQDFAHISSARPLPTSDNVRFLFGCEAEIDKTLTLALSPERYDEFDFIVISTTHFHMQIALYDEQKVSAKTLADAWVKKFDAVLNMDLPFHKIGIAHLACDLIAKKPRELYLQTLEAIPLNEMQRLFRKAADLGVGIELNGDDFKFEDHEADAVLRMFRVAKDCGCKFFFGSDSHSVEELNNAKSLINKAVDLLDLKEIDKYDFTNL